MSCCSEGRINQEKTVYVAVAVIRVWILTSPLMSLDATPLVEIDYHLTIHSSVLALYAYSSHRN